MNNAIISTDDFVTKQLSMKRRVLIVDDEEINRLVLKNTLDDDYTVLLAQDGREAFETVKTEKGRLSLILLDLHMPVMDGYEFYELLQKDADFAKIPVIVLTSEKEAEVKSLKMGVADFIPKPYDVPEVIHARIDRIIQLYEDKNIITSTQFDTLTGLFNREYFLEYSMIFDQYYPDYPKDVVAINFNRFHVINAVHGREFGDRILAAIGKAIKEYVDSSKGLACRYNADLFYLYLKSADHEETLYRMINDTLNSILGISDTHVRIGILKNADSESDVRKRFDLALLACNSISRNYNLHIAYYDDKIREKEQFEEILIRDLDSALGEEQFKVYYQPKYSIQADKPILSSAEALIRWVHPKLGMISPGAFIPLFEKNGLIGKVDRFVWRKAAEQIAAWKLKYGIKIPVSVNVSRIDIMNEGLTDELKEIVAKAGISPKDYFLEVTESAYTDNQSDIFSIVEGLRKEGFTIEMDDFGTGYSSLNMLTSLPFDVLKLDMVFVRNIHTDARAKKLVEFILDIAKYLNVRIIAEGVECKEQYEILKEMGCDVIQGYYFSKPVDSNDFERFIEEGLNSEVKQ